jgi:hypothetical protein
MFYLSFSLNYLIYKEESTQIFDIVILGPGPILQERGNSQLADIKPD